MCQDGLEVEDGACVFEFLLKRGWLCLYGIEHLARCLQCQVGLAYGWDFAVQGKQFVGARACVALGAVVKKI